MKELTSRPKNVLYFAENALSPIQGGGIVAYAVLKDLPPQNLLGFFEFRNITPAEEFADRFVWLGSWRRSKIAKRFDRLATSQFLIHRFIRMILKGSLTLRGKLFSKRDLTFVLNHINDRKFKPEIVYFSGLSLRYLRLAVLAAEHFNIPMSVLHMDDWMAAETDRMGIWGSMWKSQILNFMKRAAARSLSNTTNSPRLARIVTEMTGFEYTPANNCCSDMMDFLASPPPPCAHNQVPVITYAGALNSNLQGETIIKAIATAIAELSAEGTPIHLHIYTPWEFAPLANSIAMPNAVFYKGQVNRKSLAQAYWDSDFLITTVTYRPKDLLLFKHSLSTKLSEYLCMGKPVISAGHPDWHLHEYVQQHQCGWSICFDENFRRAEIKQQLKQILATSREERALIGQRNRKLYEEAHDVVKMAGPTREAMGLPVC